MTEKIIQDWEGLKKSVHWIHLFLAEVEHRRLPLGAVVKTDSNLIGVITGMDAPTSPDKEWTYSVLLPDTDYAPDSDEGWYDASQLELVKWESPS